MSHRYRVALFASVIATACGSAVAHAATIPVTTTADSTGGPACSLRDAIAAANSNMAVGGCPAGSSSGADTIDLTALAGTITLGSPLPNITSDLAIQGPGFSVLTISGNDLHRVFFIDSGTVGISGVT